MIYMWSVSTLFINDKSPPFTYLACSIFHKKCIKTQLRGQSPFVMSQSDPSPSPFTIPPSSRPASLLTPFPNIWKVQRIISQIRELQFVWELFLQEAANRWLNLVACGLSVMQGGFTGARGEKWKIRQWVRNGTFDSDKKKCHIVLCELAQSLVTVADDRVTKQTDA